MSIDDRLNDAFTNRANYLETNVQTLTKLSEFRQETGQNPEPERAGWWTRNGQRMAVAAVMVLGLFGIAALVIQLSGGSDDEVPSIATNPETGLVPTGESTPCNMGRYRITVPAGWEHYDDPADCLRGHASFAVWETANIARGERPLAILEMGPMFRRPEGYPETATVELDKDLIVQGVTGGRLKADCPPVAEPCIGETHDYGFDAADDFEYFSNLAITPNGEEAGIDTEAVLASVDGMFESSFELVDEVAATEACNAPNQLFFDFDNQAEMAVIASSEYVDLDGDGVRDDVTLYRDNANGAAFGVQVNFASGGLSNLPLESGNIDQSRRELHLAESANQMWVSEETDSNGFTTDAEYQQLVLTGTCDLQLDPERVAQSDLAD